MPGPRIYSLEEADALVPRLEEIFRRLDDLRERMRQKKIKMNTLEMIWGEGILKEGNPDRREHQHYVESLKKLGEEFGTVVAEIESLGAVMKGLDAGLIDFYHVKDRRLVFLCWKRGEAAIRSWHHIDEGFAGRHPLDQPAE